MGSQSSSLLYHLMIKANILFVDSSSGWFDDIDWTYPSSTSAITYVNEETPCFQKCKNRGEFCEEFKPLQISNVASYLQLQNPSLKSQEKSKKIKWIHPISNSSFSSAIISSGWWRTWPMRRSFPDSPSEPCCRLVQATHPASLCFLLHFLSGLSHYA